VEDTEHTFRIDPVHSERVTLPDGSEILLQCVTPAAREPLKKGFERLSPDSRYLRFFSARPALSDAELTYLTEVDGVDHVAIGALRETASGLDGVGIARFVRTPEEPTCAEPAVAVIDAEQGRGIGAILLDRLIAAALERGITHFSAPVLADNATMTKLLSGYDGVRWTDGEEPGVRVAHVPLLPGAGPVDPEGPGQKAATTSPLLKALGFAAGKVVEFPIGRALWSAFTDDEDADEA
jgi:GNAT superfamily N-acetyltransferase